MKVVILGAGIASLATYAYLKRELPTDANLEITIYEAHPKPQNFTEITGGGLGLQINGLLLLKELLTPEKFEAFKAKGFQSWKCTMRNSKGKTLGFFNFGMRSQYGEETIMVPRMDVHEAVKQLVPEGVVQYGRKAKRVWEENEEVKVEFESGETVSADLVLGADGVRSIARRHVGESWGEGWKTEAVYNELVGVGGFVPMEKVPASIKSTLEESPIVMTFGRSGFFGYSPARPFHNSEPHGLLQWWSTAEFKGPPPPRDTPLQSLREQLLTRHGEWKDPAGNSTFADLISSTLDGTSRVLILPEYKVSRLPQYSSRSGRVILLGDAAHAMPPSSGQGVSCAIEDAKALALLLRYHLSFQFSKEFNETLNLATLGEQYTRIRKPRVDRIMTVAERNGDQKRELGWIGEKVRDVAIWVMCRATGQGWMDEVVRHDIKKEVVRVMMGSGGKYDSKRMMIFDSVGANFVPGP